MDFYLHAITGKLLTSTAYPTAALVSPSGKLQSTEQIRIQYSLPDPAGGTSNLPCAAPNPLIKFGLKQTNHYSDTTFDVYTDTFTAPSDPTLPTAFYTASLDIDSVALRALFPVATDGTSPTQVPLMGEILSGGVPSDTFTFLAINNVIKNTESPAISTPGVTYPAPAAVLTPGKEDVFIFECPAGINGEFAAVGAPAFLLGTGVYNYNASPGDVATSLMVISGARTLSLLVCTEAGITELGTLPAAILFLDVSSNLLPTEELDGILAQLVANGKTNGNLSIEDQNAGAIVASAAGYANALILQSRGWTITADF